MAVSPSKDVDGFHPENFGKMALDMSTLSLLHLSEFRITRTLWSRLKENISVIGRSHIVGDQ
jgi:methylenetetrahydrofolate dehydrogenase (NADP+)/methenyltetrahydrofolate cyclohydrolase